MLMIFWLGVTCCLRRGPHGGPAHLAGAYERKEVSFRSGGRHSGASAARLRFWALKDLARPCPDRPRRHSLVGRSCRPNSKLRHCRNFKLRHYRTDRCGAGQPEHHAIADAGAAGVEIERIDPRRLLSPGAGVSSQAERAATLRANRVGGGIRDKVGDRGPESADQDVTDRMSRGRVSTGGPSNPFTGGGFVRRTWSADRAERRGFQDLVELERQRYLDLVLRRGGAHCRPRPLSALSSRYVPTSSAAARTCPCIAVSSCALVGRPRSGRTVSRA